MSSANNHRGTRICGILAFLVLHGIALIWISHRYFLLLPVTSSVEPTTTTTSTTSQTVEIIEDRSTNNNNSCLFRDYDYPSRYYGIGSPNYPPPFLRVAHYIYGEPPVILQGGTGGGGKLCSNSGGGVANANHNRTTMMDGTNPSLLSVAKLQTQVNVGGVLGHLQALFQAFPDAVFLASLTFKRNHQCQYPSPLKKPWKRQHTKEVDVVLVNGQFETLVSTTIANGTTTTHPSMMNTASMDDGRLFLHEGDIWLSYKRYEGDGVDGNLQLFSKLHVSYDPDPTNPQQPFQVQTTGDPIAVCCGRNLAPLEEHPHDLSSSSASSLLRLLTWPDPVTLGNIDTGANTNNNTNNTNKGSIQKIPNPRHKSIVGDGGITSVMHGTSGFLVYLADQKEYLGIGHFHRQIMARKTKEHATTNPNQVFAKFGHHYTHAFFTIAAVPPFALTRLSPEFVLEAPHPPQTQTRMIRRDDAEMIQFASGLELLSEDNLLAIAYGINDCEAAVITIAVERVNAMLRPVVGRETQIVHTMERAQAFWKRTSKRSNVSSS